MHRSLSELAERYFTFLSERFPVMCASDEFHFMPRVERASLYYDKIDELSSDAVQQFRIDLKSFKNDFDHFMTSKGGDYRSSPELEELIDLELLDASIAALRIEFEQKRSWQNNPLLYLKIALIGLDHALTKPAPDNAEMLRRTSERLRSIPRLLEQAAQNMVDVPEPYYKAALQMTMDARDWLAEIERSVPKTNRENFTAHLRNTIDAIIAFGDILRRSVVPCSEYTADTSILKATLKDYFRSHRSPTDVFKIGLAQWNENHNLLKALQKHINSEKPWKTLYTLYAPQDVMGVDTLNLYQRETTNLRRFFQRHGFGDLEISTSLEICPTPTYLRSIRGAASFSAAFSSDREEKSLFYITTQRIEQQSKRAASFLRQRLHREYKFLAAHETVPGHHLLDHIRREIQNPIRRQIESPLFYEGWASYAESLLNEYDYIDLPIEQLVLSKRNLWRAARCQVDVGLVTGKLSMGEGEALLRSAGFTQEEAEGQIKRFRLNPGYQLCYSLGRYEILKLRETYGTLFGKDRFHRLLLEGGELPFHLIARRLAKLNKLGLDKSNPRRGRKMGANSKSRFKFTERGQ